MPPKEKWFFLVSHSRKKTRYFSEGTMNNIHERVVAALLACEMTAISEGDLYYSLFKVGISAHDATSAVKQMLEEGALKRSGCAFVVCGYVATPWQSKSQSGTDCAR